MDQTGLVTGVAAGTVTITATVAGVGGTANITVQAPPPVPGPPASIVAISGDTQNGTAGAQLPASLIIEVQDAAGVPVPGATVDWTTPDGGSIVPSSGVTDSAGRLSVVWTLGPGLGPQTAVATVQGTSITFTFTATAQ